MELRNVYTVPTAPHLLYQLLGEREDHVNISHRVMPTMDEHYAFMDSMPYKGWYLIDTQPFYPQVHSHFVGSIYLTRQREVGIFLFREFIDKGFGAEAVKLLRARHPGKLFANISPGNEGSAKFFKKLGFRHIQQTYRLD